MIPDNIMVFLEIIIVTLSIVTTVIYGLVKYKPTAELKEIWLRIRTWWMMIIIFMIAILLGPVISLVFFALLSFLALREFLSLIPTRSVDRPTLLCVYLTIPMQYLLIANGNYEIFVIFVPLIVFLFLASSMVLAGETPGFISAISTLNWGLMLTVYLLGYVGFVLVITSDGGLITSNAVLVLFLVFLTELNDVAQYTFGKLFGTTTAIIKVSPNKTAEGFAGGLSITILSAVLIGPWLTSFTTWESLIAGILIGVAGFLGDITISAVKRDLGIKDTGRLLPGHGGVLDRVDSLLFTAPVFFHYIYQFKLY